jgi:hypothetical protein
VGESGFVGWWVRLCVRGEIEIESGAFVCVCERERATEREREMCLDLCDEMGGKRKGWVCLGGIDRETER